ncbi:hypothetical protein HDU87_008344 [Geranomyces variabilis]|uniref:Extracellular membrane protein CFEM domain-containing protein n=1 Tax=Geranomyces variabilis TaxID=109894 RepID=A0AAD5XPA0_9FUNG|nr:hypothetical protein HDU87_008344 [Geranomyces variabilis]
MKLSAILAAALATATLAQSPQNSSCIAPAPFSNCYDQRQAQLNSCPPTDAACLCRASEEMVFCYVNFCASSADLKPVSCHRTALCTQAGQANLTSPGYNGPCDAVSSGTAPPANGTVVSANGTMITPNGTVITPNGTVVPPSGLPVHPSPAAQNGAAAAMTTVPYAAAALFAAIAAMASVL